MKTFPIQELMLVMLAVCTGLGSYSLGVQAGKKQGHLHGYAEAEDHYQVMLSSYAESPELWDHIGEMWREYPDMEICGESFETEEQWKAYVRYHAQRNGWKDAGVFKRLEDIERVKFVQKENGDE